MSKYSAEEVREMASALINSPVPREWKRKAGRMLNDYAERIETDERAMPDVVAIMSHLPDNRAATRAEIFRALRLTEQTPSPAQAAQMRADRILKGDPS